jgi:2-oxoglutarate dehydrogenase E1 component
MKTWQEFAALNAGQVGELYERYRRDPASVDAESRAYFARFDEGGREDGARGAPPFPWPGPVPAAGTDEAAVAASRLVTALRTRGHLAARIDPLGTPRPRDPELDAANHIPDDLLRQLPARIVAGAASPSGAQSALQVVERLRAIYCSATGYEYGHLDPADGAEWLREAIEGGCFRPPAMPVDGPALLARLTEVEAFERFLHRMFPGRTRFSIEGVDMLVPILDTLLDLAAGGDVWRVLIGMAHRGRLNVLAHVLRRPYAEILAEFKGTAGGARSGGPALAGDVAYHAGCDAALRARDGTLRVTLAPNPSHVEAINPVLEGMARAAATRADQPGAPEFSSGHVLPILIHGDAALPGQGVVAETLNLARLRGYTTGGTIHVVTNNQLGYTTDPGDASSTPYPTDPARGFHMPIVHVNADAPEACVEAARLAFAYRARFHRDVLVDLVGYRRHGHNEGDEPAFTQPVLYGRIARHPTVRARWAASLAERRVVEAGQPDELMTAALRRLQDALASARAGTPRPAAEPEPPPAAGPMPGTAVAADRLRALEHALLTVPEDFTLHPKLERAVAQRRSALDTPDTATVDWATAEQLALASLLSEGIAIRLTGQDTERGTFSQRHAVWHDARTGQSYVPLQTFAGARAACEVRNSPLSENAALAFEYGYSVEARDGLVLWEAQYGDFVNGAQVVVDEFVASARAKWGQCSSLVLLLPHGAEGQGPDHSSARLERFLEVGAGGLRVAACTTAAQYFHLLRLQALLRHTDPRPLVVLTPKSLLRHPRVASPLRDLADGAWQPVLDDDRAGEAGQVRRAVCCSGKIAVDLLSHPAAGDRSDVAVVRLEQLAPFPTDAMRRALDGYPALREIVWVQEEPRNMGAWGYVEPALAAIASRRWPVRYIGRAPSPSPAEGSYAEYLAMQTALLERAWSRGPEP